MASIRKEIPLDAPAEAVWDAVRDWENPHERLVPGFVIESRPDGDARIVTFANGAVARELIVDVDDEARRLVWSVVDSPLGMEHHNASAQVFDDGDGRSRLVWIADVFPHEAGATVGEMMEQGGLAMQRALGPQSAEA